MTLAATAARVRTAAAFLKFSVLLTVLLTVRARNYVGWNDYNLVLDAMG